MKPKTMILMIVAIGCGLGASYMTSRLLAERQTEEPETVQVFVAKKNLDMGTLLKKPEDLLEAKPFLKGAEPPSAILKLDEVKGRVLKRSLRLGDAIRGDDLFEHGQGNLDAMLPSGYRAIGLRVTMKTAASGFATLPGSRVDILSTIRRGSDRDSFTQVLLQNVLVLAADTQKDRNEHGAAMPASVVVVALSVEETLKVNLAEEVGSLSLVLRKFDDNTKTDTIRVSVEDILGTGTKAKDKEEVELVKPNPATPPVIVVEQPKEAPLAKGPVGKLHTVTIIEGDRVRYQRYMLDENDEVIEQSQPVPDLLPEVPAPQPNQPQVGTVPQQRPQPASPAAPKPRNNQPA